MTGKLNRVDRKKMTFQSCNFFLAYQLLPQLKNMPLYVQQKNCCLMQLIGFRAKLVTS